ncbi:MAG: cbb3-type cytochrome oxidase assembly protein CcoS [Chromatiales bacterium]|nr:cbb3-type cytochrome oxidase assembly protein CcoS [Chromatiales bacterium]
MEVIYGLIPGMLILGLVAVAVLFWAARSGQFDDLEGDGQRLLLDEDEILDHDRSDPRSQSLAEPETRSDGASPD